MKKSAVVKFSSGEGGLNCTDDPGSLRSNELQYGTNNAIMLRGGGWNRFPGALGLSNAKKWSRNGTDALCFLKKADGTEVPICINNGNFYTFDKTNEAPSSIGVAGFGYHRPRYRPFEFSNVLYYGNTSFDGTHLYKVGVAGPAGSTAVAAPDGNLPFGVYKIFVGYAIYSSGTLLMFTGGEQLADVTLSGENQKISFTVPAPTDSRVTHVVAWMTDSGGSVWYFYKSQVINGTDPITMSVLSAGARDASLTYTVDALDNKPMVSGAVLACYFKRRLWAFTDGGNTLYYSKEQGSVWDLQKWPSSFYITLPYSINAVFFIGEHLYISTDHGLIYQPYGDVTNPAYTYEGGVTKQLMGASGIPFVFVNAPYKIISPLTIEKWKGGIICLTDSGVRLFDGTNFSENISRKVMPEINKMYAAFNSVYDTSISIFTSPYGIIYRRGALRNEYILAYCDKADDLEDAGIQYRCNNRALVLDLDRMSDSEAPALSWEMRKPAGDIMAVDANNILYFVQNIREDRYGSAVGPKIWKENSATSQNLYIYGGTKETWGDDGSTKAPKFITTVESQTVKLVSRRWVAPVRAMLLLQNIRLLLTTVAGTATVTVAIDDGSGAPSKVTTVTIANTSLNRYRFPLPANLKGYTFHLEYSETSNSPAFMLDFIELIAAQISGRFI